MNGRAACANATIVVLDTRRMRLERGRARRCDRLRPLNRSRGGHQPRSSTLWLSIAPLGLASRPTRSRP